MEEFIARITKEAGDITKDYFHKTYDVRAKANARDVVTDADVASNEHLVAEIKKHYPDHGFISEELGEENSDREWVWIIDPLDGTYNFSRKSPFYCVMVALTRNGVPEYAAIDLPMFNQLFVAKRGAGATCNGETITMHVAESLALSCGMASGNSKPTIAQFGEAQKRTNHTYWVHNIGCAGFGGMMVASGQRDWLVCNGNKLWDHAAQVCILREVGCKVTNLSGEEWTTKDEQEVVAAHPSLHQEILDIVRA